MPRPESPDAQFDRLKSQLQNSILSDYPNPERKGCPGEAVLKELAARPLDDSLEGNPHWHHVTHCSECYREFLGLRRASAEGQGPPGQDWRGGGHRGGANLDRKSTRLNSSHLGI